MYNRIARIGFKNLGCLWTLDVKHCKFHKCSFQIPNWFVVAPKCGQVRTLHLHNVHPRHATEFTATIGHFKLGGVATPLVGALLQFMLMIPPPPPKCSIAIAWSSLILKSLQLPFNASSSDVWFWTERARTFTKLRLNSSKNTIWLKSCAIYLVSRKYVFESQNFQNLS